MLTLVLFGLFVILTIVGIFKKDIEDKLFLVYSVLACLIVGYTIFGLFKVFYITLNDAVNLAIAIALMIIPVILKFNSSSVGYIHSGYWNFCAKPVLCSKTHDQNCNRGNCKGVIPKMQDSAFLFKTCRLAGFKCKAEDKIKGGQEWVL